ncbi:amidohydrolase family protein, partial [Steroidobacter sp.]|uniref:amidohydrolase family protein n=1 Tax=Steroidobacter sp. TaxID=1978227 RepID=UPI001A3EB440
RDVEEPRLSPDGRFLYYTERLVAPAFVYFDANQMNYGVRRLDLDSGQVDQLIDGFGGAVAPQVSRDGKRLAFVRRVQDKTVLFSYDLASGAQQPVYDQLDRDADASYGAQGAYYPRFDWFPDNRHVAIWGKGKLYRIDMDSGNAVEIPFRATATHQLTKSPRFGQDLAPEQFTVRNVRQLSPANDGKSIVFTAVGSLWKKTLPEGTPTRMTKATAFEFEPSRSADGRFIAYVEWDDEKGSALKVIPANGGTARTVITSRGLIREPSFSPDGKQLVYRIHSGDKLMGGFRIKPGIYVVPVAGGESRYLTLGNEAPRFSADGKRIIFTRLGSSGGIVRKLIAPGVRILKSVNLDGQDERELANTADVDTLDLRLSPDEQWIAFRERQQYYVMRYRHTGTPLRVSANSDAAAVAKLTSGGGYSLTWSNDSSSLYWTLGPALFQAGSQTFFSADAKARQPVTEFGLTLRTDKPEGVVAFTNARVITMRGEEVIERGTVMVERNRIAAVGPSDGVKIPANAKIIDATGKTIMPGLMDMHGHTECCIGIGQVGQKQSTRYAQLSYGVTTNFDPYSREQLAYESNETNLAGVTVSPRWIPSGMALYGRPQMVDSSYVPIESYDDARTIMMRKRALGGTFVKSYRQPTRKQRQMLVKAGHEFGIMVDAEGEGQFYENLTEIFDGHTNLEHNLPLATYYDDIVQLMKNGHTSNTPTLVVLFGELFGESYLYESNEAWKDPKIRAYVMELHASSSSALAVPGSAPPYARAMTRVKAAPEIWEIGFRSAARSIKKLDDAGVTIHAGSHGQVPGLSLHWELWLLAEGGMSNHRVLRTATANGAKTLMLDRQLGSLEPGKLADLIVLDANPLEDIRNTNTVRYTMLNGRLYDSLSMNEIGNYNRPRTKFYWELQDYRGIDWNESWSGQ